MKFDERKVINYKNKCKAIVGKKYYYGYDIETLSDDVKDELLCGVLEDIGGMVIFDGIKMEVTRRAPFEINNLFWEYIYPAEEDYSILEME